MAQRRHGREREQAEGEQRRRGREQDAGKRRRRPVAGFDDEDGVIDADAHDQHQPHQREKGERFAVVAVSGEREAGAEQVGQ